jgi:hypothetical protein
MVTMRAITPAVRRQGVPMCSRFKLRSSALINRPIHVTGCPIVRTSQSG